MTFATCGSGMSRPLGVRISSLLDVVLAHALGFRPPDQHLDLVAPALLAQRFGTVEGVSHLARELAAR